MASTDVSASMKHRQSEFGRKKNYVLTLKNVGRRNGSDFTNLKYGV